MARTTVPQQAVMQSGDLQVGDLADIEGLESSEEEENQLPFPDADSKFPSDEASCQLHENNRKLRAMHTKLEQRKKNFQNLLKAYHRKEMEFVAQMDTHMDEVENTEHALSLKIESLSAENHQLRTFNEKRERENSQLADRLSETTKQCSESETRVQFLVDRIVALLSSGAADASQTEAVVQMRQRERDMLRQLEETRAQFDEVRQQNGELHSRLTEELSLSRRLQEQLVEVEERFAMFHQQRTNGGAEHASLPGIESSPGLQGAPLGRSDRVMGELSMPPRGEGRRGRLPMGDPTEVLPERERHPHAEVPPPISEVGEMGESPHIDGPPSAPLGAVLEGEVMQNSDDEYCTGPLGGDASDSDQHASATSAPNSSTEDSSLSRAPQGARNLPTIWPSGPSPRPTRPSPKPAAERPMYSRTTSAEGVLLMEQKLREALDRASFECAVVRIENGIYNFGPNVCAIVELGPSENDVVACQQGGSEFVPIDEFIRSIAQRPAPAQPNNASSSAPATPPSLSASSSGPPAGVNKVPAVETMAAPTTASEAAGERRVLAPTAKAVQPYAPGGAPVPVTGGQGAASSTTPRRVTPGVQAGASAVPSSAVPPSVALGRQGATATPERLRMPTAGARQPSPVPTYAGGQMMAPGPQSTGAGPQVAGQRMLVAPSTGGAMRYGVTTMASPRQLNPYQQTLTSPRPQG